jgi:hypothetical protein
MLTAPAVEIELIKHAITRRKRIIIHAPGLGRLLGDERFSDITFERPRSIPARRAAAGIATIGTDGSQPRVPPS